MATPAGFYMLPYCLLYSTLGLNGLTSCEVLFLCFFLQVLLGLTDEDLELGLGVSNLMHRRKLRLAIEDYRDVENGRG